MECCEENLEAAFLESGHQALLSAEATRISSSSDLLDHKLASPNMRQPNMRPIVRLHSECEAALGM